MSEIVLVVAIADVSYYVRHGTPLDVEPRARATSVYFPDRVLAMLETAMPALVGRLSARVPWAGRLGTGSVPS